MKNNFMFLFIISLHIYLINAENIFILESAVEKPSSNKNILSFEIKAGIIESIESNIEFQIESEFYENDKYIKDKNIDCNIPRTLEASYGTQITIKCLIDLYEADCLKANKVKFLKFKKDENLKIDDHKQNVLLNNLIFEQRYKEEKKKEEKKVKADIEFNAEKVIVEQYKNNKLIFLIKGQYNSIFTLGFDFDLIVNKEFKAKCRSPNLVFEKEAKINCTLEIDMSDYKLINSMQNGIVIEENVYKIHRLLTEEKVFKFSIKDGDKLEIKDLNKNKEMNIKEKEEEEEKDKRSEWEIQREIEKRKKEKEKEDEKKKKDQDDLENLLKKRQQIMEEENKKNAYNPFSIFGFNKKDNNNQPVPNNNDNNIPNNNNNNNYNLNNNNDNIININNNNQENEVIDYNSNVKLIHLQVRYSYDIIYYMFYALTPVPLGHKIKVGFTLSTGGYNYGDLNKVNRNIILKTEEEITPNDKSVIVEYVARFECPQCKKIVLDPNNIYGAKVYNIPKEEYLLDAINVNQNGNYLQKSKMISPPLFISENVFNQNCMIELAGSFFNKNKFFISRFALTLIGTGYYNPNRNITLYCGLNEREIFSCPIQENLNNFEFTLEPLIINQKENIIIDNSRISKDRMTFHASCQTMNNNAAMNLGISGNNVNNINNNQKDPIKNPEQMPDVLIQKRTNWKKIGYIIIGLIVAYYILSKCCCKKEEDNNVEYDSRWRVSSESYGLRNSNW